MNKIQLVYINFYIFIKYIIYKEALTKYPLITF